MTMDGWGFSFANGIGMVYLSSQISIVIGIIPE
jgi:hypothetical protein